MPAESSVGPASAVLAYIGALPEPKRATLLEMRRLILEILPEAEECLSYGMPAFRVDAKVIAGFAAFKAHLGYFPHSGTVLEHLPEVVAAYPSTRGGLRFGVDSPLPRDVVEALIRVRLAEIAAGKRR